MLSADSILICFHSFSFQASTTTYSAEDMCGPPATTVGYIDPGLLHYVVMNGYVALYIEISKMFRKSNKSVFDIVHSFVLRNLRFMILCLMFVAIVVAILV